MPNYCSSREEPKKARLNSYYIEHPYRAHDKLLFGCIVITDKGFCFFSGYQRERESIEFGCMVSSDVAFGYCPSMCMRERGREEGRGVGVGVGVV